jgi:hypothetical protein
LTILSSLLTTIIVPNDENENHIVLTNHLKKEHQPQKYPTRKDKKSKDDDDDDATVTIGVASTVTGCGSDHFVDGAAVLKYSLDKHRKSHKNNSKYKYKSYIMYHPDATECVLPLQNLGYILLERPTPVNIDEIQGQDLRERIANNGCCGEVAPKQKNIDDSLVHQQSHNHFFAFILKL